MKSLSKTEQTTTIAEQFLALCNKDNSQQIITLLERMTIEEANSVIHIKNDYAFRHYANYGRTEVVQLLLDLTPDPGLRNRMIHVNDDGPFRNAANNRHIKVMKVLLDFTHDPKLRHKMIRFMDETFRSIVFKYEFFLGCPATIDFGDDYPSQPNIQQRIVGFDQRLLRIFLEIDVDYFESLSRPLKLTSVITEFIAKTSCDIRKTLLRSAVVYLTKMKLPDLLVYIIVDFIKVNKVIFSTQDISVLRALVLKQKNSQNIKHSSLLDTGDIVCSVKDLISVKKLQQQSIQDAEKQGVIGPREIIGFDLEDVEDDGNCFYYAVTNQMKIINHNFIQNVPAGTDPNNSLRLAVQGGDFRDREWADDSTFDVFVTEFPDVILAVIDTRNPNAGFTCYYINDDGAVITNTGEDPSLIIPQGKMIIRIAATGNHFMSVKSHPEIDRGLITSSWTVRSTAERLQASDHITQTDIIIEAVFSIKYDNPLLNHEQLPEILKIAKAKGGAMVLMELMNLKDFEAFEFLETEKVVDQIIEQNFFLNNEHGRKFVQIVANHFDKETLLTMLELGRDQEIAEQILIEAEEQGTNRVISILLGKELPLTGTTDNLENIIGTQELNQLQLMPNGIFNSWSNKAYLKVVEYIDNLAKTLDGLLNTGKSGSQVAVTLAWLEEWLGFVASGQRFIGGRPSYYNPDDNDDWSYRGGDGGNSSAGSFDNQYEVVGLILPSYNGADYNITDHQM